MPVFITATRIALQLVPFIIQLVKATKKGSEGGKKITAAEFSDALQKSDLIAKLLEAVQSETGARVQG